VLIENQIERTDHTHLGQILTYAAGLEAVTVIWVAERFTDEHRAALDWLNEITEEKFTFFGLEVELWRIGTSDAAPKFNIVSKPNDWTKSVSTSVRTGGLTEKRQLQLRYWTAFRAFVEAQSPIRCAAARPQNYIKHPIGLTGAHLSSIAAFWNWDSEGDPENRVELVLNGREAKRWFEALAAAKTEIEQEFGVPLAWFSQENAKKCIIATRRSADISDEKLWPEQFEWLRQNLELFAKVFTPRLKAL
jgi:hypothetical protein